MKKILLTQGKVAFVDDEDFERISHWKWHYGAGGYVLRGVHCFGEKQGSVYMHREVMAVSQGVRIDHIDGNRLNNQKCNLRTATHQQNQWNRGRNKNNKTGFKGVCFNAKNDKYIAYIWVDNHCRYLGSFITPQEASVAYRACEIKLRKEFAHAQHSP